MWLPIPATSWYISSKAVLLLQRIIRGRASTLHQFLRKTLLESLLWLQIQPGRFQNLMFEGKEKRPLPSLYWRHRSCSTGKDSLLGTSRWRKYDASLSEWWSSKMYGLLIFVDINWHSKDLEVKPAAVRGKSRSTRTAKVLTSSTSYAQLSGSPKPPRGWKRRGKLRGHQEVTGRPPGGHQLTSDDCRCAMPTGLPQAIWLLLHHGDYYDCWAAFEHLNKGLPGCRMFAMRYPQGGGCESNCRFGWLSTGILTSLETKPSKGFWSPALRWHSFSQMVLNQFDSPRVSLSILIEMVPPSSHASIRPIILPLPCLWIDPAPKVGMFHIQLVKLCRRTQHHLNISITFYNLL